MRKKALIIKIGAIGDVILSLSMLHHLKDFEVTWVVGSQAFDILKSVKGINNCIFVDEKKLFKGPFFQRSLEIFKVWKKLFCKKYDMLVIAHSDWRYRILPLFVRADKKKIFSKKFRLKNSLLDKYFSYQYSFLINKNKINTSLPEIYIKKPYILQLNEGKKKKIAVVPGGAKNALQEQSLKRWPIDHYKHLVQKFIEEGIEVILLGDKNDLWCSTYFQDMELQNLISKTTLIETLSILKQVDLVICHDSGPLHMANIVKAKILALFGPTDPAVFAAPSFNSNIKVLFSEDVCCSFCYDGRFFKECSDNKCLKNLSSERVFTEAMQILK